MRNLWTTKDICLYFDKTSRQVAAWRKDGLRCTELGSGYVYYYKDIVEYLGE